MENNFGPARNLPLNFAWSQRFEVRSEQRAICEFSFNASFENAILVYDVDQDYELVAERGNYSRKADTVELAKAGLYLVAGWHKNGRPNHRLPWEQSPKRVFVRNDRDLIVGFEDAGQDDYDDGLVKITFRAQG
jgi:hypothetical protein